MKHKLGDKLYYSMGEVAKAFDVNPSLIRFWEKEFEEIQPKKNAKGNRKFSQQDLKTIDLIYHLVKERGFTLEGAKIHLREDKTETLSKFELIRKLKAIKSELISIKNKL